MTRCSECSDREGRDVDHTQYHGASRTTMPPTLAQEEHWLAFAGAHVKAARQDHELPNDGKRVPGAPMAMRNVYATVRYQAAIFTEIGYLKKADETGRWSTVPGKDVREISVREVEDYLARVFPPQRCGRHVEGKCVRCCRPDHKPSFNRKADAIRVFFDWLHFAARTPDGRPLCSKPKLRAIYELCHREQPDDTHPPMNSAVRSIRFAQYLVSLPDWPESEGRAYGWMAWFGQHFCTRFSELVQTEYPMAGPTFRFDRGRGEVQILGKGRKGGKQGEPFAISEEEQAGLEKLLAWRERLGARIKAKTGRDADPVLFPNLGHDPRTLGRRRSLGSGSWNTAIQRHGAAYNDQLKPAERKAWTLDADLLTSHRLCRATGLTKLGRAKAPQAAIMARGRIVTAKVAQGYERYGGDEMRGFVEDGDELMRREIAAGSSRRNNGSPLAALDKMIADPDLLPVRPILVGTRTVLADFLSKKGAGA